MYPLAFFSLCFKLFLSVELYSDWIILINESIKNKSRCKLFNHFIRCNRIQIQIQTTEIGYSPHSASATVKFPHMSFLHLREFLFFIMYVGVKKWLWERSCVHVKKSPGELLGYSLSSSIIILFRLAMTYCQPMTVYIRTPSS